MAFNLKKLFHTSIAQAITDEVQLGKSAFYYFIGRILPWGNSDAPPDAISNTFSEEVNIRNEVVALAKINPSDVSMVIDRTDWIGGILYDMWDSTIDMEGKKFFVLTEDFNVYKCIDNNYGALSTFKPTGTSVSMLTTPDGYIWKYMFTIPLIKRNKFESGTKIPVQRSMSDSFYDVGSLRDVVITNPGSGYIDNLRTTLTVTGGSPLISAVLIPIVSEFDGSIRGVVIENPGSGYLSEPTIQIQSDTGAGAGIWNSEAKFKAILNAGQIVNVTIEDSGIGYPSGGTTIIEVDGDGQDAQFSPIISGGKLVGVSIDNRGYGYTYMHLDVIGSGTGATLLPYIGFNDLETDQSLVESTAIDGGIHVIKVTQTGESYTTATCVVSGDGVGCSATPIIENGEIVKVRVDNPGTGYTSATVSIVGNNLSNNPAASSAIAYAIVSPIGGHGKDAPRELYADTLCMHSIIRYATSTATNISQDFRMYGLLKNPKKMYLDTMFNDPFGMTTFNVTLTSNDGLIKDAIVNNGTKKYRIVDIANDGSVVILPLNTTVISAGDSLMTENLLFNHTVTSVTSVPLVNKYTGEMLFVSADYSFAFNTNQSVTIKTYMKL